MDQNTICVTGRLTRDPELRSLPDGKQVASMRVAVNGFKEDDTTFLDVSAWGKTGENAAKYLAKGARCGISGRLKVRQYEHNGENRTAVEIVANDVVFLNTKAESQAQGSAPATPAATPAATPVAQGGGFNPQDDIPF